jgi:anti-sigma factor RsiW
MTERITDMDIEALIDNELDTSTALRVRHAVERDPSLHRKYAQLMTQKRLLQMWWSSQPQH